MNVFSAADKERISAAITQAERQTSGEIVVVVAAQSDGYHYVPPLIAAIIALLVPWVLIYFTHLGLVQIYLIQLAVFALVTALLMPLPLRTSLVPSSIKHLHARRRAMEQFLVQNLDTTAGRTGVLLFISCAEHHAEIIADRAINNHVPEGVWQQIIDDLTHYIGQGRATDGFIIAIGAIGDELAAHFPPGGEESDDLPDHLIVLP